MGWFICIFFCLVAILIFSKIYYKLNTGWCRSNVCLIGKTAIVTGGNSGIGYETAADFAMRGARVILACRNAKRGKEAEEKIIKSTNNPNVVFKHLDLVSFKSVREFAEDINGSEERLDILVNNAGVGYSEQVKTDDGLSYVMQSNYFGHFLLTNLLLDLLRRTGNSRIVNVSSLLAKPFLLYKYPFDINDLNHVAPRSFTNECGLYSRSKWCIILFTIELAKRLKGTTTTAYSLHPGLIKTNIFDSIPHACKIIVDLVVNWTSKDSQEGAQTSIYCSVESNIEHLSGKHFHDCKVVNCYQTPLDPTLPRNLWRVSEELVKLNQK